MSVRPTDRPPKDAMQAARAIQGDLRVNGNPIGATATTDIVVMKYVGPATAKYYKAATLP